MNIILIQELNLTESDSDWDSAPVETEQFVPEQYPQLLAERSGKNSIIL